MMERICTTLDDVVSWLGAVVTLREVKPILETHTNTRLHSSVPKPAHVLVKEVQLQIGVRLRVLDQDTTS